MRYASPIVQKEKKIQVMEKASVAFTESNREINTEEVVCFNTNYGPKKTLFMTTSAEVAFATALA